MLAGLMVGLLFVLTTFSLRVNKVFDTDATWAMMWLHGALLVSAALAPSIWVGLFLAWVGLQTVWLEFAGRVLKTVPPNSSLAEIIPSQGAVLVSGMLYIGLAYSGVAPKVLDALAVTITLWAFVNAISGEFSRHRGGLLPHRETLAHGYPESALVGSNHMFGWLCGLGLLSATYLSFEQHFLWTLVIPMLAIGLCLAKNITGVLSGLVGLVVYLALRVGWSDYLVVVGIIFLAFTTALFIRVNSDVAPESRWNQIRARWRGWKLMTPHITWTGRGLGYFKLIGFQTPEDHYVWENAHTEHARLVNRVWDHAHNEWLQALIEMGPFPLLFAGAYLVYHFLHPGSPYAMGLLAAMVMQSLTYFPLHMPGQIVPLLVAMAALDSVK